MILDTKPLPEPLMAVCQIGTNFSEILIETWRFSLEKIHFTMLPVKWWKFYFDHQLYHSGWICIIVGWNVVLEVREYLQISYKSHLCGQVNCWSLRCSWSIACRRCSNYIFILDLTHGFNWLGKDNCKIRRETFKFWDLMFLILEIWQYFFCYFSFQICEWV